MDDENTALSSDGEPEALDQIEGDAPEAEEPAPQDEEASGASEEGEVEAPQPRHRANERIRQEIARRKALEDELAVYRQAMLEQQRASQAREAAYYRQPQIDPQQEQAWLDTLNEQERVSYYVNKATAGQNVQLQQLQLMMYVQQDKHTFDGMLSSNPVLKKYANDVETRFHENLQKGQPRSREEILDSILGSEVRRKGSSVLEKARKAGEENMRRQQTRPYTARSGVSSTGSTSKESAEARLKRRLAEGAYRDF